MNKNKFQILSSAELAFKADFYKETNTIFPYGKEVTEYGKTSIHTEMLPYASAKLRMGDIFSHITENGYTDGTCSFTIAIKIKGMDICKVNKCKFIMSFDEDMSYRAFPKRKNRIGAKSIKAFTGIDGMNDIYDEINRFVGEGYGVDFTKIHDNYIKYGYIGGSGYENKFVEASALCDYYITHLYSVLEEPAYTVDEVAMLKEVARKCAETKTVFDSYDNFAKVYKNAEILVDMSSIENTASVFWTVIKQKLKDIFLCGGIDADTRVSFNYDSDSGAYQIRETEFNGYVYLSNMDIVECKVSGKLESCDLYSCVVEDSILNSCSVMSDTKLHRSNIYSTFLSDESVSTECRIFGDSIATGKCDKCVIGETVQVRETAKIKNSINNSSI